MADADLRQHDTIKGRLLCIRIETPIKPFANSATFGALKNLKQMKILSKKKELVVHIRVNKGFKEINSYNSSNIKSNNSLIIDSLTINAFDNSDYNLQINSKIININSKKNSDLKLQILSDKIFVIGEESSTIKGTFDSKEAIFKLLDKSSVNIDGSTTIFEIETLGNTSFKGKDFKAKNAVLNVTNSSDTYVNAIETIDIRAKNSSNVYLYSF